jgi:hypothetical protein
MRTLIVLAAVACLAGRAHAWPQQSVAEAIQLAKSRLSDKQNPLPSNEVAELSYVLSKLQILSSSKLIDPRNRRACDVGGDVLVLRGAVVFSTDTLLECPTIRFVGASIRVERGSALVLLARTIDLDGDSSINGIGMPGEAGTAGANRPDWQSQGDGDYWAARRDCQSSPGNPAVGGPGTSGGNGGNGAVIIVAPDATLYGFDAKRVQTEGGPGGPGGPGGQGALLRNGRNFYCDGCMVRCPSGPSGPVGSQGTNGRVIVLPFVPPSFERFDDASQYRLYPDPRVSKGKLRVWIQNLHRSDPVVFEIWDRNAQNHALQWQLGGGETLERDVDTPAFQLKLVWVGHHSKPANEQPRPDVGWRLDFKRVQ